MIYPLIKYWQAISLFFIKIFLKTQKDIHPNSKGHFSKMSGMGFLFPLNLKFQGSFNDFLPDLQEIHIKFHHTQHRITKHIIQKEEIYRQQDLVSHLKRELQIPFEFELVREGKLLTTPFSGLFASPDSLTVDVVFKYIWNINEEAEEAKETEKNAFFRQRKIDFKREILDACEFQKCVENLKRSVTLDKETLRGFSRRVWNVVKLGQIFENIEADKSSLVGRVILLAITNEIFLKISTPFGIKDHYPPLKVSHAVVQMLSDRALLLACEDYSSRKGYMRVLLNFLIKQNFF